MDNFLFELDNLIDRIDRVKETIDKDMNNIVNTVVDKGTQEAKNGFGTALYTGINDVIVKGFADKNKGSVEATGENVLFIEFGTGITNPEHPMGAEMGMTHGTYGKGLGASPNGWFFKGEKGNEPNTRQAVNKKGIAIPGVYHTKGNVANKCMYNAMQTMKDTAEQELARLFE